MSKLKFYGKQTACLIEFGYNKYIGSIWYQDNSDKDYYKTYRLSLYGKLIGFYPTLEICKMITEQRILKYVNGTKYGR